MRVLFITMTLRKLRTKSNLSQGQVARKMGVTRPTITRLETVGSAPTMTLKAYADAIGVEFTEVSLAALETCQSQNGNLSEP